MSKATHPRTCEVCKITFYVRTYRLKQNPRFCSFECMGIAMRCVQEETRACEYCGEPFVIKGSIGANKRFCSRACFWRDEALKKTQKALDRFWDRMDRCGHDGDLPCPYCCWEWKDGTTTGGYGKLSYNGKDALAHRRAWEIHNERTMPPALDGAHYCHNRRCCNPFHIHAATRKENAADALRDGRTNFGSRQGANKLTEEDIPEIFYLRKLGWTYKDIAAKYNVHETTIKYALQRRTWKNVLIDPLFVLPEGRGRRLHPDTPIVAKVYALWKQKKRVSHICFDLGISEATAYRYIHLAQEGHAIKRPTALIIESKAVVTPQIDRMAIYERDRGICHICRRKVSIRTFTLDHLIPRSDGGLDIPPNLAVAHLRCNTRRFTGLKIFAQLRLF